MKHFLFLMITFLILCQPVYAEDKIGFSVGAIFGEPTGLSVHTWVGPNRAIDGAAAWSFEGDDALHLHADYLFYFLNRMNVEKKVVPFYFYTGIGGRIKTDDDGRLGVRFPLGINYLYDNPPFDVFLEIAPILDLAPETAFRMNGGIGIRYFIPTGN